MYTLGVRRQFESHHYLIGGDWGDENVEHSHHYQLELIVEKETLDRHGFLVDIVAVEKHLDEVIAAFQGQTLNSLAPFAGSNPSIEVFATIIHGMLRPRFEAFQLEALTVTIWEDDIAWTSYRTTL